MGNFKYNPFTGNLDRVDGSGGGGGGAVSWKESVATQASLPLTGNTEGDARVAHDTDRIYVWSIPASSGVLADWLDAGASVVAFADITGNATDNTSLATELSGKSDVGHTHTESEITDLDKYTQSQVDTLVDVKSDLLASTLDEYLILNLNGLDGATSTVDSSQNNHTPINFAGTAQLDDSYAKFGTTSLLLDGNNDSITVVGISSPSLMHNNTDSKSLEFTVKRSTTDVSRQSIWIHTFGGSNHVELFLEGNTLHFKSASLGFDVTGGTINDINEHHIAVIKVADEYGVYLDGVQVIYLQESGTVSGSGGDFAIGSGFSSTSNDFTGNIDEVVYKPTNARFNASPNVGLTDTITVPTSEAPDNTEFLAKIDINGQYQKSGSTETEIINNTSLSTANASAISTLSSDVTDLKEGSIQFPIDGGGSPIGTGIAGWIEIPYNCTITGATMTSDVVGSSVVDIWTDTFANYPPTDADSITGANELTITASNKVVDTTLTGWSLSLTKGSYLYYNVDSNVTIQKLLVALSVTRT